MAQSVIIGNEDGISLATLNAFSGGVTHSPDQDNPVHKGVTIIIDITSFSEPTGTLVVTLVGKDPVSGKTWTFALDHTRTISETVTTTIQFYPTGAGSSPSPLPRTWAVRYSTTGTRTFTGTISASLVL